MLLQYTKIINLNIHPSLLPKYRGANPIRTAIQQEETVTGVSLIEVVDELDGGDLFWQQTCTLDEQDNYVTLESRLIQLAKTMITEKLSFLLEHINRYRKAQNHQLATCSYK